MYPSSSNLRCNSSRLVEAGLGRIQPTASGSMYLPSFERIRGTGFVVSIGSNVGLFGKANGGRTAAMIQIQWVGVDRLTILKSLTEVGKR